MASFFCSCSLHFHRSSRNRVLARAIVSFGLDSLTGSLQPSNHWMASRFASPSNPPSAWQAAVRSFQLNGEPTKRSNRVAHGSSNRAQNMSHRCRAMIDGQIVRTLFRLGVRHLLHRETLGSGQPNPLCRHPVPPTIPTSVGRGYGVPGRLWRVRSLRFDV